MHWDSKVHFRFYLLIFILLFLLPIFAHFLGVLVDLKVFRKDLRWGLKLHFWFQEVEFHYFLCFLLSFQCFLLIFRYFLWFLLIFDYFLWVLIGLRVDRRGLRWGLGLRFWFLRLLIEPMVRVLIIVLLVPLFFLYFQVFLFGFVLIGIGHFVQFILLLFLIILIFLVVLIVLGFACLKFPIAWRKNWILERISFRELQACCSCSQVLWF